MSNEIHQMKDVIFPYISNSGNKYRFRKWYLKCFTRVACHSKVTKKNHNNLDLAMWTLAEAGVTLYPYLYHEELWKGNASVLI